MTGKEVLQDHSNLEIKRLDAAEKYPGVWKTIISQWNRETTVNSAWLTYSANYLFHTAGVRWAIDPFSMSTRIPDIAQPEFATDLQKLELVALTHAHNDHFDLKLIRAISSLPIQWVIPEDMLDVILSKTPIARERVVVPLAGEEIKFKGVTLTPFASLHIHALGGVNETGYLATFEDQKWLFPGDIRNFDASRIPSFGRLNGVFAHLWLGKGCAKESSPPYLQAFCDFYQSLSPERIVITHLNEFGRDETELWDETHYKLVKDAFGELGASIKIEMALMGAKVLL